MIRPFSSCRMPRLPGTSRTVAKISPFGTDLVLKWHRATITPTSDIEGAGTAPGKASRASITEITRIREKSSLAHSTKMSSGVVVSKTCFELLSSVDDTADEAQLIEAIAQQNGSRPRLPPDRLD